jgi:uncharacterized cupredoxin-like copper-binding protein
MLGDVQRRQYKAMHKRLILVGFAALFAMLVGACGGSAQPASTELSVQMVEFSFTPANTSVPADSTVTLNLTNDGTVEHNWVLMEAGYEAEPPFNEQDQAHVLEEFSVPPGTEQSFTFQAPAGAGEYQVVCSVAGHLEAGMEGTLTVTQ